MAYPHGSLVEIPHGGANDSSNYYGFPIPTTLAANVLSVWLDDLDILYEESANQPALMVLSMNPSFVGRRAELSVLEELLTTMKNLPGVWFARCDQVAAWWSENHNFNQEG